MRNKERGLALEAVSEYPWYKAEVGQSWYVIGLHMQPCHFKCKTLKHKHYSAADSKDWIGNVNLSVDA